MSDLLDDEVNQILKCLEEQGITYTMSKEAMKKILKNSSKKPNPIEEPITNEEPVDMDIEFSKVVEDTENSKMDIEDESNIIEQDNVKIENNIENNIINISNCDVEKKNDIELKIEEKTQEDNHLKSLSKDDIELDGLIESSNRKLKEILNKKNNLKKKHTNISDNLKSIRQKLDENYNNILDKHDKSDKLKDTYISQLDNIKNNLETITTKNNIIIPPLNLDGINNTSEYPNFEIYNKLHNKILSLIQPRNNFHKSLSSFISQNKYQQQQHQPHHPKNIVYPPQSPYLTERRPPQQPPPQQSPYLTERRPPPQQSPYLTERRPPPQQSPYLTERRPPQSPYLTERRLLPPQSPYLTERRYDDYSSYLNTKPPQQGQYLNERQPLIPEEKPLLDERYNRFTPTTPNSKISLMYEKYLRERYPNKYQENKYVDFDELCKKYETDRDNEHEIIITSQGHPSNAMDIINNALDKFEKEFYVDESKNEKSTLRSIFDKLKNNKKTPLPRYDKEEQTYYESIEDKKKTKIDKLELKISQINNIKTPLRFRVLQSNLPLYNKSMIINKIEDLFSNKLLGGSEITKYSNWINSLLKVPFKKYKKLPIDIDNTKEEDIGKYLVDVKKTLDTAVYGHTKTKEQVIQIIAQWITNPNCIGNCIGIQGVMGNGKTTLVKNGIAKAIGRPFAFITLGGCSDASFLEGHNYTYEGSMWGKIVDVLMECKCMNPVFYFDELDKVSETPKGEEIINSLIHLTDSSQNNQYADKYFNGVEFDLSKSLFIFSYNDITKINPILLDRLICIKTDKFELDDKIHIAKNHLLKEIYEQLKIKEDTYKIEDDDIKYIIETYTGEEGGVRTLKKHLYNIFSKFNLLNLTKNDDTIKYTFDLDKELLENKVITTEIIDIFIKNKVKKDEELDDSIKHWYM